jgi:N-acetylmuramoyl-L-alanine amidase
LKTIRFSAQILGGAYILFLLSLITHFAPYAAGQDSLAEVYNLRYYTHPNFTRIVVDIGVLREYAAGESQTPGQIFVDILQTRLNPIVREEAIPIRCDYINFVRISQKSPSTVRVLAEVEFSRVRRYQIYHVFDPFRVVIDIYPQEPRASSGSIKTPQPAEPAKSGYSMVRQLGLGIKTIVIDPGHGGIDPGCLDSSGQQEKELTLDISLRLKDLLNAHKGLEVILTRETDIHVPLETRTVIANQKRADIFLSIHINAFRDKSRRGIETFFLNFSPDPGVNELAARENATTTKTIGGMEKIIKKIVQNSNVIESRELAEKIQENLVQYLARQYSNINNLGVKGGPFWTLLGSDMPSVLVEVSHLTNAKEAQRLKNAAYRQQIARGIYEGILAYRQSLGKG